MKEKKLTADDIREAVKKFGIDTFREEDNRVILSGENYVALVYRIDDQNKIIDKQKAEIERLMEENAILKGNPPMCVGRSNGKTIRAKLLAFDKMKEQNAELQKQVEKLKEENEYLDIVARQSLADYQTVQVQVDELTAFKNEAISMSLYGKGRKDGEEVAVKDTAKEIWEHIVDCFLMRSENKYFFKEWLQDRYGVEVE